MKNTIDFEFTTQGQIETTRKIQSGTFEANPIKTMGPNPCIARNHDELPPILQNKTEIVDTGFKPAKDWHQIDTSMPSTDHTQWSPGERQRRGLDPIVPKEENSFDLMMKSTTPKIEIPPITPFKPEPIATNITLPDTTPKPLLTDFFSSKPEPPFDPLLTDILAGANNSKPDFSGKPVEQFKVRDLIGEKTFKNQFGDDKKIGGDIHTTVDINPISPTFGDAHDTLRLPGIKKADHFGTKKGLFD